MIALVLAAALCNAEVCPGYGDNPAVEPMTDPQGCRVLAFRGKKNFTYWAGASWSRAGEVTTSVQWHELVKDFRKGTKDK